MLNFFFSSKKLDGQAEYFRGVASLEYGLNCLCCGFAIADMSGMRKGRMRRNLQEKKREKEWRAADTDIVAR